MSNPKAQTLSSINSEIKRLQTYINKYSTSPNPLHQMKLITYRADLTALIDLRSQMKLQYQKEKLLRSHPHLKDELNKF